MKLVLIQGDILARYEDRKQGEIVRIGKTDDDYIAAEFIESFRVNGIPVEAQLDQA